MNAIYPILKAYKGLVRVDLNHLIDNTKIFKRNLVRFEKFDSSVYCVIDEYGNIVYYGKGKFDIRYILSSRACNHRKDLLTKCLKEGWTIRFIAIGVTDKEARALEAHLIESDGRPLTKFGATKWDGSSHLINKKHERAALKLISEHLIYGNNTRIAA